MPKIRPLRQPAPEPPPGIDEKKLLAALRDTNEPISPLDMHAVCSMVVIACHDRVATRDFLIDVLRVCDDMYADAMRMDRAVTLQVCIAQLDARGKLHPEAAEHPQNLPKMLRAQFDNYLRTYTAKRLQLADMMELLTECPPPGARVS